jgi:hypothetical protein
MAVQQEINLIPTSLRHIFMCDIDDSGLLKEIALVKKFNDGSIYYIEVEGLHAIDKSRIKKIVSGPHADKYQLWQLMADAKLSNGMNALDFFHSNNVKVKRVKGSRAAIGQGLATVSPSADSGEMIGSNFVNPAEASLDTVTKRFS